MGVSGCGKSTVGALLARELTLPFLEGDSLHPAENVALMAAGHPLDDEHRRPWLDLVGAWLADGPPDGTGGGVAACSALARRYRDQLRAHDPQAWFLHLEVDREVVLRRVSGRRGHYMPASLVDSQLATLEPLAPDEAGVRLSAELPVRQVVRLAAEALRADPATGWIRPGAG